MEDELAFCPVCDSDMDYVDCYQCQGVGGFDMYEALPLEYEPGEWEVCEVCDGEGGYLECMSLPHKEATA